MSRRSSSAVRGRRFSALAGLIALASVAAAGDPVREPSGCGPLRFGMSLEEARSLFSKLAPLEATPVVPPNTPLQFMQVPDERFEGLGPCTVVLGFVSDHFYEARYDCMPRTAAVDAALRKRFGAPTSTRGSVQLWQFAHTTVALNAGAHTFTLADRGLTQALQTMIMQRALSGHQGGPPAAPPP